MPLLTRLLGVATAGYGVAVLLRPEILAKPCELLAADGSVPAPTAALARAVGVRDLVSGVSLVCAPDGRALWTTVLLRASADFADAVLFGTGFPDRRTGVRAAVGAGAWGVLCLLSTRIGRRRAG